LVILVPLDNISAYHAARKELCQLHDEVISAQQGRDAAQERFDRLERPAQEIEKAIVAHAAEKASYDHQVVSWYESGCIGQRPVTPPSLLLAEHRIGEIRRDIGASTPTLEAARQALDEQNRILGSLAVRKQSAIYRVIVEDCREHLHSRAVPAMIASLMELSIPETLAAELRGVGVRDPEALSAAHTVEQLLVETRQSVAVRGDLQSARAFISALAQDPQSELPAPQPGEIEVVELEPRTIKPAEDGSVHINRSNPEAEAPQPISEGWWPNPAVDPNGAWRHLHPDPIWSSLTSEVLSPASAMSEEQGANTAN
jgi:hypothetical protein